MPDMSESLLALEAQLVDMATRRCSMWIKIEQYVLVSRVKFVRGVDTRQAVLLGKRHVHFFFHFSLSIALILVL